MTRRDWLLLLVGLDPGPAGLEPVRVQKALFLLAREGGIPSRQRYWFVAYNYGPMSPRVYRDADALVRDGLLERLAVPGYAWGRLRATERGQERVRELVERAAPPERAAIERLRRIRDEVTSLTFAELLESVYARYPDMAAKSVFRRRSR